MMAVVSLRRKSSSEWAAGGPTAVFRLHSLVPQMRREIRRLTGKSAHSHLVFILLYEMESSGYFTGLTWHTNTLSPMSKEDQIAALLTHRSYSSHSLYSDCTPAWNPDRKLHVAWQTYNWKQNNKTVMSLLHVCIVTVWTREHLISPLCGYCCTQLRSNFKFYLWLLSTPGFSSRGFLLGLESWQTRRPRASCVLLMMTATAELEQMVRASMTIRYTHSSQYPFHILYISVCVPFWR